MISLRKPLFVARGLLIFSYSLLYLLFFLITDVAIWEPLFQAVFHLVFIATVVFSYPYLSAAFLQAMGSARVDSALRRIGGVAGLVDVLHEFSDMNSLLHYTQTSLSALLAGDTVSLLISRALIDSEPADPPPLCLWHRDGCSPVASFDVVRKFAQERSQIVTISQCPVEVAAIMTQWQVTLMIPVSRDNQLLAVIFLRDHARLVNELHSMLAFFARQVGIALERILLEQRKRYQQERAFDEKSAALATLSATIAHEMRTPLSGVRASISGVDSTLPELIEGYRFASAEQGERFPAIREERLEALSQTGPRIRAMVDQANHVIDLLLVNLKEQALERTQFTVCSMADCVEDALHQYPFKRLEREKVSVDVVQDFTFLGVQSLLVYVLFNLLKNALYSIESAGKGSISLRIEATEEGSVLLFEDTGLGIDEKVRPHIFEGFFSTRSNGTGAGLAFCKRTMQGMGGDIEVTSELGKYTRFTLSFPPTSLSEETS